MRVRKLYKYMHTDIKEPRCKGKVPVAAPPEQPVGQGSGTPEGYKPHQRGDWESAIAGALKQAIDAHGPITKEWIGSAAKRIVGLAKAWRQDELTQARTALGEVRAERDEALAEVRRVKQQARDDMPSG